MFKKITITAITIAFLSGNALALGNSSNAKAYGGHATNGDQILKNKVTQNSDNKSNNTAKQAQKSINNIKIEGDKAFDLPVNSAYAPIVYPIGECMGSLSGGVTVKEISFSLGGTKNARPCNYRMDSVNFTRLGYNHLAYLSAACRDKEIRELTRYTVHPCPNLKKVTHGIDARHKDICAYPTQACKDSKRFR